MSWIKIGERLINTENIFLVLLDGRHLFVHSSKNFTAIQCESEEEALKKYKLIEEHLCAVEL